MNISLDNFSTISTILATIGGGIISLFAYAIEIHKQNKIRLSSEKRIEYKLRIYEILIDDILSFDEIVSKFNASSPFKLVDQIELRKCIYEMIVEDNIISFDDGTYTANTASSDDK